MTSNVKSVKLSDIDTEDIFYRITTDNDIEDLARSIEAVGLLSPPLLTQKKNGYKIIYGFNRIKACLHLGLECSEANIADFPGNELEYAKLAITDNAFQRSLNILEQSRSIQLLKKTGISCGAYNNLAEKLGLPVSVSEVRRIEPLCILPEYIQNSLIFENISQYIALELGKLAPDESLMLTDLFDKLKMSFSKQKEISGMLKEVAARDDKSITDLLCNNIVTDVVDNHDLDINSRVAHIRKYLKELRFPSITAAENTFNCNLKKLKFNKKIKLIPPHGFEGPNYTLSLNFKSMDELSAHYNEFGKALKSPYLKKILE